MITCIIIDDEKPARDALELMLQRYLPDKVKVLHKAASVKEGVFAIYKQNPDLVFLDIEMPTENGFELFNYFQQVRFSVIFTTAYREYAIKAVKVAALDYFLKPINANDLKEAIGLFEKKQMEGISVTSIDKLVSYLNPASVQCEKIALPTFSGFQLEKINSIVYCEAEQNYTHIFLLDDSKILVSKPLSAIEQLLPGNVFFRIHKSHIVNLNYVKTYSRTDGFHVVLENGIKLVVATRRNEEFLKALTHKA